MNNVPLKLVPCKCKKTFKDILVLGVLDKAVEKTDIIRRLNDKGTMHILTIIWQSLNPEELGKAMQVSQTWNAAILSDRDAIDR